MPEPSSYLQTYSSKRGRGGGCAAAEEAQRIANKEEVRQKAGEAERYFRQATVAAEEVERVKQVAADEAAQQQAAEAAQQAVVAEAQQAEAAQQQAARRPSRRKPSSRQRPAFAGWICIHRDVHGDDTGLVLPPHVASQQVVIVPNVSKKGPLEKLTHYYKGIRKSLDEKDIRVKLNDRSIYNPGWKYVHGEQKGVLIMIEVGPRNMEKDQARMVVRLGGEKVDVDVDEMADWVEKKLKEVQESMFIKAKEYRDAHLVQVTE